MTKPATNGEVINYLPLPFFTALNFKVSKVNIRVSESLLTDVTGRSKCIRKCMAKDIPIFLL